jgi:hypothetical protein
MCDYAYMGVGATRTWRVTAFWHNRTARELGRRVKLLHLRYSRRAVSSVK